jgi:hypothetical protein
MRYVAKLHVLDVMDQVVVSGYVYDADDSSDPDHVAVEFTYQTRGTGISEPLPWLLNSLYRCLVSEETPSRITHEAGSPTGGAHTLSETGDLRRNRVDWTVVGGPGGG